MFILKQNYSINNISSYSSSILNIDKQYYPYLGRQINLIVSPILLTIGAIGNILCIIILFRKKFKNPTITYLSILAVFDLLVLFTGLLRNYLKALLGFDIRHSTLKCKIHIYLTYACMQASTYILVAVTLHRLCIMYERKMLFRTRQFTNNPALVLKNDMATLKKTVLIICTIVGLMNIPFLVFYEYTLDERGRYDCTVNMRKNEGYYIFRTKYYGVMHLVLFVVLPCIILIVSNILIIIKITSTKAINSSSVVIVRNKTVKAKKTAAKKRTEKRTKLTIMLIVVCVWFIVLKTPASVYITFPVVEKEKAYFPFTYQLFMLINYTNNAVNFILYSITNSDFRNELKILLKKVQSKVFHYCKKQPIGHDMMRLTNNKESTITTNKNALINGK